MTSASSVVPSPVGGVVIVSPDMERTFRQVRSYASRQLTLLLVGATGTGKEVLAREAHRASGRTGPFIDNNCGGMPRELVESLLFGSRRGAYTGSVADMTGLFEQANGGTLYLDELCSLPVEGQAKLLRAIEQREVRRVGDERVRRFDCLLVTSVQEDPHTLIREGRLRKDLYYRIAVGVVRVPSLAERPGDIGALAVEFTARQGQTISLRALGALKAYGWPGNVRELQTVLARAGAEATGSVLTDRDIRRALRSEVPQKGNAQAANMLLAACIRHDWNARAVARELGVSKATLYRHMAQLGISRVSVRR